MIPNGLREAAPELAATARVSTMPHDSERPRNPEDAASSGEAEHQPTRKRGSQQKVILISDRQLRDVSSEAVAALAARNDPPRLFMRGGALSKLIRDEHGRVRCEPLRADGVRHELSKAADWKRFTKDGDLKNTNPPMTVAGDLLVREWDELPALKGLLDAPCLRPDGSLLDQPGYDPVTGLWLDPEGLSIPPVPTSPSDDQVEAALALLMGELLGEFAFADDPSWANALAFVLTAALRPTIAGLVPLALVNAPIMGSGKTFLDNIAAIVASGRPARLTAAPGRDDEELRKRLTSILIQGEPMIVFDNVSGTLSSSVLAQALTATSWSDRILGSSTMINIDPKVSWSATGNNIQLGGDLARRCYPINLDPRMASRGSGTSAAPTSKAGRWPNGDSCWLPCSPSRAPGTTEDKQPARRPSSGDISDGPPCWPASCTPPESPASWTTSANSPTPTTWRRPAGNDSSPCGRRSTDPTRSPPPRSAT
ncbi:MAG TPA: hypothetical protein VLR26_08280 [Frankiaceae bacterium]|nr:hypothetical protein [Frankiaceae bacterium]